MPGCKTKLHNPDEEGNGEICFWGRHVFMGYLNMPDKTEEAIDAEGWLHSGDLGKHDETGFLFITGRIKGAYSIFLVEPDNSQTGTFVEREDSDSPPQSPKIWIQCLVRPD